MRKKFVFLVLMLFILLCVACVLAQEVVPEERNQKTEVEEEGKTIIPSPKDIKEKTAIFAFMGWMWLSIVVLIFILRSKIKEADRLHLIKFFSNQKK